MTGLVRGKSRAMVTAIVRRDLTVVRRSRAVTLPIVIVPIVLFVGLPILVAVGLRLGQEQMDQLRPLLDAMPEGIRSQLGRGTADEQLLVYLLEYQFATLFLIIPLMVAAVIAADSFAGEKERKTVEALLYTPTTDLELYVAKLLGPWLAAMGVAVAGFVLYAVSANVAAGGAAGRLLVVGPLWLVIVFWLSPAVAAVALGVLVQVSARVRGFQEAYQLGGAIVLPVVALLAAQFAGVIFLDVPAAIILGALVWLVAAVVLWAGSRTFRRESQLLTT